jgi:peptide deformylase
MAVKEILKLGNPELLLISEKVDVHELQYAIEVGNDLNETMLNFQNDYGWGRAIAAPQIGVKKRIIFRQLEKPQLFINPEIVEAGNEIIELWDDCMSFPDLLVKVKRNKSCTLKFTDANGEENLFYLKDNEAELIQHEIDHLDGILATMRAIDGRSFSLKSERHL